MAMAVLKQQGAPPSGGGKLKPPKNTSEMERLVAQAVVDMSAVRAKLPPVKSISELEEWELHQRLKLLGGSSTGGGGGEDKTWYPSWTYDANQPALWNLLWNAEIMTPVGKRFTPEPEYKGNGLSPPQRPGLMCQVQWDNVVDFETALVAAKQSAIAKSNHSARSRGYPNLLDEEYQRSFKVKQDTERIVQSFERDSYPRDWDRSADPSYFTREWRDSEELDISAFEMGGDFEAWDEASNEEYYTTTLVGDTTDSHMSCLNISISAAMAFHQGKMFSLSYSTLASAENGEVWVYRFDSDIHSDHYIVKRMPELDFYYMLEEADSHFSISDNVFSPDGDTLTDWAVDQIFNLHDVGGEFRSWHTSELMQLWMEENHQATQRDAHREYLDTYNEIVEPSYAEIMRWHYEYKAFHQKVWASYRNPQPYEYKQPRVSTPIQSWMTDEVWRHGSEWRKYEQLVDDHYSGTQTSSQQYTETEDLQASGVGKFSELSYEDWWNQRRSHDALRYHCWLVKHDTVTAALDEDRMSEGSLSEYLPRTMRFMDSVPVNLELLREYESPISRLGKWVSKKLSRFNSWLDEPIFKVGKSKLVTQKDIDEVNHFIDEEVVNKIASRIIAEGTAHDDSYDLEWLEQTSVPTSKHDLVAAAVKQYMQEEPKEIFSDQGIFLGRQLTLPRMPETGLILLSEQEGSTLEDSSSILLPR